jgi:predicted Co/Zn/Cd cation transporter (cation efflux family)
MTEARALTLSAWAYAAMAGLGIGFYFLTRSEAILLDGAYNLISFLMTLVAQRVARLVDVPQTEDFHFGFAHFEPLLNTLRTLLIIGIGLYALASSVEALFHGGRPLSAGHAVVYGALAASGCFMVSFRLRRAARHAASPLLRVDADNWFLNALLSTGVGLSFVFAYAIQSTRLSHWVPYVDPVLVTVLVLVAVPGPLRTLADNLSQVLMAAPEPGIQADIRGRVEAAVSQLQPSLVHVRMLPYGRFLYIQVHVLLRQGHELGSVDVLDALRSGIHSSLAHIHPRLVLDVVFTADRRWVVLSDAENAAAGRAPGEPRSDTRARS